MFLLKIAEKEEKTDRSSKDLTATARSLTAPEYSPRLPFFPSFLIEMHGKRHFSIENHRKRGKNGPIPNAADSALLVPASATEIYEKTIKQKNTPPIACVLAAGWP